MNTMTGTLPPGTETEDWRVMSAHVALTLWRTLRRAEQPADPEAERIAWEKAAPDFRAHTRKVLRDLVREGIRIDNIGGSTALDTQSDTWRERSARIAWRFWLADRRLKYATDETAEAAAWEKAAPDYRATIRSALRELDSDGIGLLV